MHTYMHVYMYLSICLVPPQNPPFLHFCNFSCHFWLPSKYLELAINCKMCRIEDWRFSEKLLQSRSGMKIEDWRFSEKLLQSRSGLKIEDWRFSEKLLQSRSGFTSSIQDWIEEVFLRIFNLQSRIGLKKFFWESSIFNPDLDWRSFFWESSIFNPIHFAINCNQLQILGTSKATKNDKTNDARKI